MALDLGSHESVVRLIEAGADVNQGDSSGTTALMLASANIEPEFLNVLLAAGADVNQTNQNGETALLFASGYGKAECALQLVQV